MPTSADRRSPAIVATVANGVDAAFEQHLRLEHVADAGQCALIEQRVGDRHVAARLQAAHGFGGVEVRREQVGAEAGDRVARADVARGLELRVRHVEADRDEVRRPDEHAHLPRRPLPALARPVDVPAPVHAHVRAQRERPAPGAADAPSVGELQPGALRAARRRA